MREKGKENGSLFDKPPSNFNNEKFDPYKVLFGTYIPPKTIQITKINKINKLLQGQNGKKSEKKKQKLEINKLLQGQASRFAASSLFASRSTFCLLVLQL